MEGKTYYFSVKAKNEVGLWSDIGYSDGITIDLTLPSPPLNLKGIGSEGTTYLSWDSGTDSLSGISYYKLYRNGIFVGSTTERYIQDIPKEPGTLTYRVTSVDKAGNEGTLSSPFITYLKITFLMTTADWDEVEEIDRFVDPPLGYRTIWNYPSGFLPFSSKRLLNGDTLIVDLCDQVYIIDPFERIKWKYGHLNKPGNREGFLNRPEDAFYLENGNVLIADSGNNRVIEVSKSGKVVWEYNTSIYRPTAVEELSNGNVLIANFGGSSVIEVDKKTNNIVWKYETSNPIDARRLSNGNTLIVESTKHRVIEINKEKEIAFSYGILNSPGSTMGKLNSPSSADRLANGNTIIADCGNSRIIEVDPSGNITWELHRSSRSKAPLSPEEKEKHLFWWQLCPFLEEDIKQEKTKALSSSYYTVYKIRVVPSIKTDILPPSLSSSFCNIEDAGNSFRITINIDVNDNGGIKEVTVDLLWFGLSYNTEMKKEDGKYTYTFSIPKDSVVYKDYWVEIRALDYSGNMADCSIRLDLPIERSIKRLTNDKKYNWSSMFSPDMKHILFSKYTTLYIMEANGENERQLFPNSEFSQRYPDFSPDNKMVVFSGYSTQSCFCILKNFKEYINGSPSSLYIIPQDCDQPSFSPDGNSIIFSSTNLFVLKDIPSLLSGSSSASIRQITNLDGRILYPSFSPDGEMIVFALENGYDNTKIWVIKNAREVIYQAKEPIYVQLFNDDLSIRLPLGFLPDTGELIFFEAEDYRRGGGIKVITNFEDAIKNSAVCEITPFLFAYAWSNGISPDKTKVLLEEWNWDKSRTILVTDYRFTSRANPSCSLIQPMCNQKVKGEVKIEGIARDNLSVNGTRTLSKLSSFTIEYGKGENPIAWNPITSSNTPKEGILGIW
ncbi:MAG: PQQ-binding-like beta-propeller repeat protein, partial [bacterium]